MKHLKSLWKRILYKIARSLYALREEPLPAAIEAIPRKERLPNEARLLSMYRIGKTEGIQEGYQQAIEETTIKRLQAIVYIDPSKQAAYDQPSPNVDPALLLRLQERKRQEALQAEIVKEQQRSVDMKTFLHIDDSRELPSIPGEMARKYKSNTGALKPITLHPPMREVA